MSLTLTLAGAGGVEALLGALFRALLGSNRAHDGSALSTLRTRAAHSA